MPGARGKLEFLFMVIYENMVVLLNIVFLTDDEIRKFKIETTFKNTKNSRHIKHNIFLNILRHLMDSGFRIADDVIRCSRIVLGNYDKSHKYIKTCLLTSIRDKERKGMMLPNK